MRTSRLRFSPAPIAATIFCLSFGCIHAGSAAQRLKDAETAVATSKAPQPAHTLALAGFHSLLAKSDAALAETRFAAALTADPGEPFARFGQMVLGQRAGHPEKVFAEAMQVLEKSPPNHPMQAIAAAELLDLVGQSLALDDALRSRIPAALERGIPGEAAHLLRSALASIALERGEWKELEKWRYEMGVPAAVTLAGPFSALRVLSFDSLLPPEKDGSLEGPWEGSLGRLTPRRLRFSDG